MKKIKKFSTLLLAFLVLLSTVIVEASAEEVTLPATEVTLDFLNDYSNAVGKAYDSYCIMQGWQTGVVSDGTANSYITYKVAKNSPVVIHYKYIPTGAEKPEFYVSENAADWSPLSLELIDANEQIRTYYTGGIGEGNKYVKIIICDAAIADIWRCDLRSISFNPNTDIDVPVTDTTLNFQGSYDSAISSAVDYANVGNYSGNGMVAAAENSQTSSYIIYKVSEGSPLAATFYLHQTNGNPIFYVSSDGVSFKEIATDKAIDPNDTTIKYYYKHSIGSENKYIKIILNSEDCAAWKVQLKYLSFNILPKTNTKEDFVDNYYNSYARAYFVNENVFKNASNGMVTEQAPDAYLVYETDLGSPVVSEFKVFRNYTTATPEFYASSDAQNWTKLGMQANVNSHQTVYYIDTIGAENKYVKVVLSNQALDAYWYIEMQTLAFNIKDDINPSVNVGKDETEIYITWLAKNSAVGKVEFTENGDTTVIDAYENAPAEDIGYYYNRVKITGLKANTDYTYRVGTDDEWSREYPFSTKDFDDSFSFVQVTDVHITGNDSADYWKTTLSRINEYLPETGFILNTGDFATENINTFYQNCKSPELLKGYAMGMIPGNHDTTAEDTYFDDNFTIPETKEIYDGFKENMCDYWYSYNNVLFISLNSNISDLAYHEAFMREVIGEHGEEYNWIVVNLHHSMYSASIHKNDSYIIELRENLSAIFSELKVDLVVSGHDHVYARSYIMNGTTPAISYRDYTVNTNGGVQYICAPTGQPERYYDISEDGGEYTAKCIEDKYGFINYEVRNGAITLTYYSSEDMSVLDEFTIYKVDSTHLVNLRKDLIYVNEDSIDYNRDGNINIKDLVRLKKMLIGEPKEFIPPKTKLLLDFVNDYETSLRKAYENNNVMQGIQSGAIGCGDNSYITFKTEKNSPLVLNFGLLNEAEISAPQFYTSEDGINWHELSLDEVKEDPLLCTYYTDGIGEANKFVKVVLLASDSGVCDLRSACYNPNTETNTTLDFSNDYDAAFTKVIDSANVFNYSGRGIVADENMQTNSYVVFETDENSPLSVKTYIYKGIGNPVFYTSSDGENWEEISMDKTPSADEQYIFYYSTGGIGLENKYIKIILCDQNSEAWKAQIRTLSYNSPA